MKAFNSPEGRSAVQNYYNMLLEHLTIPYEKLNIPSRYGNTFVLAAGDISKPPVFLLHGTSMNSAMWIKDMQEYGRFFRVYAPDLPGEPGQSDENQLPFDTDDYVNWLLDIFAGLSIEKAAVAGASLGAWLAAKFSIRYPDKVTKLAMLCPAGIGSQNHAVKKMALSLIPKGEEGLNELFREINGGNPIPEIMLNYQKLIAVFFNFRQEPIPLFFDEELRKLTMPCILFVGAKDIMLKSEETVERLSRLVPHCHAVNLPDMGHSLTGLADDIIAFFNGK